MKEKEMMQEVEEAVDCVLEQDIEPVTEAENDAAQAECEGEAFDDADFDEEAFEEEDFEDDEVPTEPEPEPLTPPQALAALIKEASAYSNVVSKTDLLANESIGTPEEIEAILADLTADEALVNLKFVVGKKDTYYYDTSMMSNRFAQIESMLQDKDMLATIADVVRTDSRLYPRTTYVGSFEAYPYYFTIKEVMEVIERMKEMEEYQDIAVVRTGNGKDCVYSTQYLSFARARFLAERLEGEASEEAE